MTPSPGPSRDDRAVPPGRRPPAARAAWRRLTWMGVAALLATAAAVAAVSLAVGGSRPDWPQAVGFAAATCLPGAVAAWIVARRPADGPARAVASSLAANVLRLLPPLAGLAWLSSGQRTAATTASGGMLVIFYLALLATDIVLHMMETSRRGRPGAPPD